MTCRSLEGPGGTLVSDILETCPNLLHLELDHSGIAAGLPGMASSQWLPPQPLPLHLPLQHLSWVRSHGCARSTQPGMFASSRMCVLMGCRAHAWHGGC